MKMGVGWLKAHLSARPKMVRRDKDGAFEGRTLSGGKDGDESRGKALDAQSLTAEQRKGVEEMAVMAGKSFDDFVADMNKHVGKHTNGAQRRGV
jgi:hypothetical protein